MKLVFSGAAHEVTGSCHYLELHGKKILVDCGMEQGEDLYENIDVPAPASEIDYILLTHAHIDHSGEIPVFYKNGFRGSVFATKATKDLCELMLRDSAHIQEFEAEWQNRKAKRSGADPYVPLYTMEDAEGALKLFVPCNYDELIPLSEGLSIRFSDVGHLLGSASIEIHVTEGDDTEIIVFSGDIGNINKPLVKNPDYLEKADYVVMETTYGNRLHGDSPDYIGTLSRILNETFARGGNVVIPAFAVGRTQEMLYFIRSIKQNHLVTTYPNFEVYVDSPLAIEATEVFSRNEEACFDEESLALVRQGINPISFPGLKTAVTSDESKAINFDKRPKVIISASGMCEAGRIRHHLKHNLWREDSTVLFVGYQSAGTIGRKILDGAKTVKLFGETIEVHAHIEQIEGISGHADQKGLYQWLSALKEKPKRVFLVHGDPESCETFEKILKEKDYCVSAPYSGSEFDLRTNQFLYEAPPTAIKKKKETASSKSDRLYKRLMDFAEELLEIARSYKHGANKDLESFASQIQSLCDKFRK